MTRKPPSQLARLIDSTADAAAVALTRARPDNADAMRDTLRSVLHAQWSQAFGGERIRLWTARTPPAERQMRKARILEAIAREVPVPQIARAERVSERWVRKLAQSLRGTDRA